MVVEIIIIICSTIILLFLCNNITSTFIGVSVIYLLVEKIITNHSWSDIGFNIKGFTTDVRKTWFLILLVGGILPLVIFFVGKNMISGYLDHVISRLPMDINIIAPTLINIIIGTFLEELIYRGFMQQMLTKFVGSPVAIIITSIIFAAMHFSKGPTHIVFFDMLGICIDSVVYGIIFAKTKNIFVSWTGHCLSDLVALVCILFF